MESNARISGNASALVNATECLTANSKENAMTTAKAKATAKATAKARAKATAKATEDEMANSHGDWDG